MFYVFLFSEAAEWEGAQLPNLLCYYYNFHQGKTHFNTLWFRSGALYACCLEIGSLEPYDFCFKVQLLFFFSAQVNRICVSHMHFESGEATKVE